MSFEGHPSTFQPMLDLIWDFADPRSIGGSIAAKAAVERLLNSRFPEELPGPRPLELRIDFAFARITGAIAELETARLYAMKARACTEFIEMVDLVLTEARAAQAVVCGSVPTPQPESKAARAAWAKGALYEAVERPNLDDV